MSLRERAVVLMKEGRTADEIQTLFVWEGHDAAEVHAIVAELARLRREAEAMDPVRLRNEAQWMLARGASVDDLVDFVVARILDQMGVEHSISRRWTTSSE